MEKDDILKRSRAENQGRQDERELAAGGTAAKVGMLTGSLVCVALVFVGKLLLHDGRVGLVAWLVYFAMEGSRNLALYKELRTRYNLIWGIIEIAFAVAFGATLMIFKAVGANG